MNKNKARAIDETTVYQRPDSNASIEKQSWRGKSLVN